jgi:hypothetical protein
LEKENLNLRKSLDLGIEESKKLDSKGLVNPNEFRKTMSMIDKEKFKKDALKKIGKRLISILNFLFYNNIPLGLVLDNPQLLQKEPYTIPCMCFLT